MNDFINKDNIKLVIKMILGLWLSLLVVIVGFFLPLGLFSYFVAKLV